MLAALGFLTVIIILVLIMTKKLSTILALILVPTIFALLGGSGLKVGTYIVSGVKSVAPTAAMFVFAILFFGIMTDAGLFDPIIRSLMRLVKGDPAKALLASAVLAMLVHLDGSGAVTFTIVIPAMLPLISRMNIDKRALACVVALAAGTMNMVPWGGPTIRAATALNKPITEIYNPMIVPQIAGLIVVLIISYILGLRERKRVGYVKLEDEQQIDGPKVDQAKVSLARPSLIFVNALLVIGALVVLISGWLAPTVVFMLAFSIALLINYPEPSMQIERINAHAKSALLMASVLFAAGAFTGIMKESKMLESMAGAFVSMVPHGWGIHLPLIIGVLALPLSLFFDPDSFYFGVLPVLATAASAFGLSDVFVARAAIVGQMSVGFPISPLTPATLLLVGLVGIDLGDHQRFTFKWAWLVSLAMLLVALVLGIIPF